MPILRKILLVTLILICLFPLHVDSLEKPIYQSEQIQEIIPLYTQSDSLFLLYEFEAANNLCKKNLRTIIKNYSCLSQVAAFGLYKVALCQFELGDYRKSDSLLTEALKIQNYIDSTNLMAGRIWYKKSEVGNLLCDCKETIPMAQSAVRLLEEKLGKNDSEVATALEVLGYVLAHEYKYNEAIEVLQRSLKILEQNHGTKSPLLSRSLCYLSRIYLIQYQVEDGMPFLDRALSLIEDNSIESNRRLADIHFFKTFMLYVMSDYDHAQESGLLAVKTASKFYGEYHPKTGDYSSILSRIYHKLGKYDLAEPLMLRIKNIFERTFGYENPVMYYSYINLGELYISQGRFDEAEYYFLQCLNIPDIKESLRIGIITNLAEIYLELDKLNEAETLIHEVIKFRIKQFGKNNPTVALSLKLLAKVYFKQNSFMTAEKTYFRIIDIFKENYGENSLYLASTFFDLAHLYCNFNMPKKAEECLHKTIAIRKKELLPGHPSVAHAYLDLAVAQYAQDKVTSSFENILYGLESRRDFIDRVFNYASSEQKLLYTKDHPLIYDPLIVLTLANKSDKTINAAAEMILQGKALVIDALSGDKAISACEDDKEISNIVEKYTEICTRISALALSSRYNTIEELKGSKLTELYKTRDSLEAELSMSCAIFSFSKDIKSVTLQEVSTKLPDNSLFIDYIKYHPIVNSKSKTNYLAYSINNNNEIAFVDLGNAESIDKLIFQARDKIQESRYHIYSDNSLMMELELKKITHLLYGKLLKPFDAQLKNKTKIFIAPDSDLNLIPFEIFVSDDDNYAIEKYEISYLSSGRDFLKESGNTNNSNGLIVVASPDFDTKNNSQTFMKSLNVKKKFSVDATLPNVRGSENNCLDYAFSPLSYSRKEGQQLVDLFKLKFKDEQALLYFSKDATTTILSKLKTPPRYVHISTHGYFCQDNEDLHLSNPLLKSGLAFTGANYMITGNVKTPFTYDDGLLTALEVTGLNLVGTELVTLSACETGIGETVQGEGVYGLRRAFQIAGAKSILMSMWKIPDKETSDLMIRFYEKLFNGASKQKALRDSALEILKESRETNNHGHPYLWGGFILTGNPN